MPPPSYLERRVGGVRAHGSPTGTEARVAGFDEATAVSGDGGTYKVTLDPQWTVSGKPNGGYLLAVLARATIADHGTHPHPLSASAVYLTPPETGPAVVFVDALRRGRTASQLRARLVQDDVPRMEALFTLGVLPDDADATWVDAPPPRFTPREQCRVNPVEPPGSGVRVEMLALVEQRLDPASMHRGSGDLRGWLSFADGSAFDPVSLLYAADSMPPATFTLGSVGWVPTLELTVYVRAAPAPGPVRVRQRARLLGGNLVDQVCEVWDASDRVVAQATQLAAVRMPSTSPAG
jgi:hypothetical protein